jgi:hypothetical protein
LIEKEAGAETVWVEEAARESGIERADRAMKAASGRRIRKTDFVNGAWMADDRI